MEKTNIVTMLTKLANYIENTVCTRQQSQVQNCISFGDLVKIAKEGVDILPIFAKKHLSQCVLCQRKLNGLQLKTIGKILRHQLPAAAGPTEGLGNISGDILSSCGLSSETIIICEKQEDGYAIRIDSNIPIALVLVFSKSDQELYRIEINEEIPDKKDLVPSELIAGWTEIRLLRKS